MSEPSPRVDGSVREAWSGDPPGRAAARQRLIEAASRCIERDGLGSTGIAAVAIEAGVSRPTVYRYFEDRAELIQVTLLHEASGFLAQIREALAELSRPADQAVEAVLLVLREIPDHPLLGQLWRSQSLDLDVAHGMTGPVALAFTRNAVEPLIEAAGWSDAEATEALEVTLRFVLSLLAAPEPQRDAAAMRAFLERRLLPALGL